MNMWSCSLSTHGPEGNLPSAVPCPKLMIWNTSKHQTCPHTSWEISLSTISMKVPCDRWWFIFLPKLTRSTKLWMLEWKFLRLATACGQPRWTCSNPVLDHQALGEYLLPVLQAWPLSTWACHQEDFQRGWHSLAFRPPLLDMHFLLFVGACPNLKNTLQATPFDMHFLFCGGMPKS